MTRRSGPIYEVTFFVDQDCVAEFDAWLEARIIRSKHSVGVADCRAFAIAADETGRAGRVCQYAIEGDDAIDDLAECEGTAIDAEIAATFGQRVIFRDRVLREDGRREMPPGASLNCLNCGNHLTGQYCGHCGQRSRSRLISLWELVTDAFGDLFEIDSRLWQTLVPLTIRPGLLTHDYLQGRRARYMPPFRMYLVLSLVFFLVAFFDPREELSLLFEPESAASMPGEDRSAAEGGGAEAERVKQEVLGDLAREGIVIGKRLPADPSPSGTDSVGAPSDEQEPGAANCDIDAGDLEDMPDWLARRLTLERVQRICERTQLDDGRALLDKLLDNVPAALIVLLPLMALILKALYPLSRRYYVEHLLFFVHFHAFFFLILTIQIFYARLSALLSLPEAAVVLPMVAISFYIPVYLFVAMRTVYGQGKLITFIKYVALTVTYAAGFMATMLGALAIAAFSI
jgi:hypothetical protein